MVKQEPDPGNAGAGKNLILSSSTNHFQ